MAISTKQNKALASLVAGESQLKAAEVAGVTARTVNKWLSEDKDFRQSLTDAQTGIIDSTIVGLLSLHRKALDALGELLESEKPGVRLGAVRAVLDYSGKFKELAEIERRLTKLEQSLGLL